MFDSIAPKYDFLNHFFSFGIDKRWRKKVRKIIGNADNKIILDVATGTADLAIELTKSNPAKIIGIDISAKMLEIGNQKIKKHKKTSEIISLQNGNSLNLKFPDNYFDFVTCAFGVRNFEDTEKGIKEIFRVLKSSGKVVFLEFSMPENKIVAFFYKYYFTKFLPKIGKIISHNKLAYNYLPESVMKFMQGENFTGFLIKNNFVNTRQKKLSFGIASIYEGIKK